MGLVQNQKTIDIVRSSKQAEDLFYMPIGKKIYTYIVMLYDSLALTQNNLIIALQKAGLLLEAKTEYPDLFSKAKIIGIGEMKFMFDSLYKLHQQRIALEAVFGSYEALKTGDVSLVVSNIDNVIDRLKSSSFKAIDYGIKNQVKLTLEKIEEMKLGSLDLPRPGIKSLEEIIPYWFDTDVILVGARPRVGKTIVGVHHTIETANQGFPVAYISLEMRATSLVNRMISAYSSIPYSRIKKGDIREHEIGIFQQSAATVENLPIFFYDHPNREIKTVFAWIRLMAREFGVKKIVLDYIGLLFDEEVGSDEYSQLTSISKKLKALQIELNIPFIVLTQLNRESDKTSHKRPTLSNLRGSGQLEQDASVIILLHRADLYDWEQSQIDGTYFEPQNTIEYIIVKNRDGGSANVELTCYPALNQINDK